MLRNKSNVRKRESNFLLLPGIFLFCFGMQCKCDIFYFNIVRKILRQMTVRRCIANIRETSSYLFWRC